MLEQRRIILSADTPCDIGPVLQKRYDVTLFPLHIILDGKQYTDGLDIDTETIYNSFWEKRVLPKTAAVNYFEYVTYFKKWVDDGCDVIHISLGSGISASHQNAKLAAEELGHVYVIDSCSLSTGFGLLVCEAGERIQKGLSVPQIVREVNALAADTNASFVLDTLEFMHAGGRCSSFAHFAANALGLKPCIEVRTDRQGGMIVGKKYSGKLSRVLKKYVEDHLKDRDDVILDRVFITSTAVPDELVQIVRDTTLECQPFQEVFLTQASCTIGSHCGPNCIGVLYLTKPKA